MKETIPEMFTRIALESKEALEMKALLGKKASITLYFSGSINTIYNVYTGVVQEDKHGVYLMDMEKEYVVRPQSFIHYDLVRVKEVADEA